MASFGEKERILRTRDLRPSFFKNELLGELEPLARLLFQGLWTLADRDGYLENRPARIKIEILPYDDCCIKSLLGILTDAAFLNNIILEDGTELIHIPNFYKHQNIHPREQASRWLSQTSRGKARTSHSFPSSPSSPSDKNKSKRGDENLPQNNKKKIKTVQIRKEAKEVLDHMNSVKADRWGKTKPFTRTELIEARIRAGASVEECKRIINYKADVIEEQKRNSGWNNEGHLRPSMFGPEKFKIFLSDSDGWEGGVAATENKVGMTDDEMEIIKRMEAS